VSIPKSASPTEETKDDTQYKAHGRRMTETTATSHPTKVGGYRQSFNPGPGRCLAVRKRSSKKCCTTRGKSSTANVSVMLKSEYDAS
jgi:hypothetical protein